MFTECTENVLKIKSTFWFILKESQNDLRINVTLNRNFTVLDFHVDFKNDFGKNHAIDRRRQLACLISTLYTY